ncbi:PVC-type heme-binding CxxCH protein [Aureliella helgolandensis]|uniref:Cytochrome c n=1 Tax=Aureliella helgolandensis TaxID=2527968 RepID=A0A518GE35_9BACT|nr:PVC-type heme-binding CxxCH protein [Aureliella helgolandensis]QDV26864.1 Cytochrome c [Aureliella helgolandensis]
MSRPISCRPLPSPVSQLVSVAFCCLTIFVGSSLRARAQEPAPPLEQAGNEKVAEIMRTFPPRGVQSDGSQPTPPLEALKSFAMRDGLSIDLVASEPELSQPLFLSWDSRGRMWVAQYRQYQYPAGLKVVRFDHHLRAVFDKVPEAPPNHVPGEDRITVFEDTNGDGKYDTHRDVITGLNIATSVAPGRGGIWVLNPPYLLFYPDADGDDVPDRDPEVHLAGFGLQDTHSVANSLMWGPDGWLYGANGSTSGGTVSSEVTPGISFQGQCIWRYHPSTKVFEIYAEGGGNTFSLEIDAAGRVFSGTNGGNTRGWYYPQGSYSHKNWGKHGPLTNPYAFGFFNPMKFEGDGRRFPQAFLIYEGGLLPPEYNGSIIAPNAMLNLVWHSSLRPDGSSYQTNDETNLLESSDRWFRPVYSGVGPDGAVYIADWYDTRLSHVSPTDDWHKESGRVYRVHPTDSSPSYDLGDLHLLSAQKLSQLFSHPNKWVRQRAVLELSWRYEEAANLSEKQVTERVELQRELLQRIKSDSPGALESLWVLNAMGELTPQRAANFLQHSNANLRRWVVRLLGDRHAGIPELIELAAQESDVQVRSQLAATAKRVEANLGLSIVRNLLKYTEDQSDPHQPLMLWWAIEAHAAQTQAIQQFASDPALWELPLMQSTVAERLMQRYAASGTPADLEQCVQLLKLAPNGASRELLVEGLNQAFQGRTLPPLPDEIDRALEAYHAARGEAGIVLAVKQGNQSQYDDAVAKLVDRQVDLGLRIEIASAFGISPYPKAMNVLLSLATGGAADTPALQRVAIQSLSLYDDPKIPQAIARAFDSQISGEHNLRASGCRTLATRASWALVLLNEINHWRLKKQDIPADVVQRLRTFSDPKVVEAVEQAFGKPAEISSPAQVAEIQRLTSLLKQSKGNPDAGAAVFTTRCATCHQLFGKGVAIGPPLDNYDRGNLQFWLPAIIAPSIEIREGYVSYKILTDDGRLLTGMIAAQDLNSVTLATADNQRIIIERKNIEELQAIETSLMPADVLKELNDTQIIDLFAYLTRGARIAP